MAETLSVLRASVVNLGAAGSGNELCRSYASSSACSDSPYWPAISIISRHVVSGR